MQRKSTSAKLQLQLLSKRQLQNLEFTSSLSCWKPRFLLTNIISIDQVLGNHPYQQESHNSSLNNRTQWVSELVTRVYRNDWTWSDKDEDIWLILVNFARSSHIKSQFRGWMQIFGIPSKVNSEYWRICWSKKIYEDEDINKSQSDDSDECVDQDDHEEDDDANGKQWMERGPKPSESELTPTHCSPLSILTVMIGRDHQNHQINHDDLFRHE